MFCPFSGQKSPTSDTKNRSGATERRRDRAGRESHERGDEDRGHDADADRGPLDGRWRSSLRDATSLVIGRSDRTRKGEKKKTDPRGLRGSAGSRKVSVQ
jgi:hypothetical protein